MTENSIPIQEFNVTIGPGFKPRPASPRPADRPREVPVNDPDNPLDPQLFAEFEGTNLPPNTEMQGR